MKNLSLRIKMILGWIIISVIPLAIVGTLFFSYIASSFNHMTKEKSERVTENIAGMVKSELQGELKAMAVLSADPQIVESVSSGKFNNGAELKLRKTYERIGSEYEGIFITDKHGVIRIDAVDKKRLGITVWHRDYFQRAQAGMANVGDPVFSKVTGAPIVVVCAPIYDNKNVFIGIVASTLKIDFLLGRIASFRIGKTGYAFMLNSKGIVISHPLKELILKSNTTTIPSIKNIAARMIRQEKGTDQYIYKDVRKVASFAPVEVAGWSIAITQDWAEIMNEVNLIRNFYMFGGAIFLFLTTAGIYIYSKKISTPIQKTLSTLNKAIEQSEEIFIIIGLDRKIQFINPAVERLTGCSSTDLVGQTSLADKTKITPTEEIWHILNKGDIWTGCIVCLNKNGTQYSLDVTITPIRDADGSINSYLEIGRDITLELKMEAQLRQAQKMEAIGVLAGGIAHDFNNILSAIFGYSELALICRDDSSKTAQYIYGILNAAGRARDLVGQILAFSRKSEHEIGPIKPKPLIREALKLLRASLPATIEIQDEVISDSEILGDPIQLHQVVMNLCTNAAYAMRDAGGVLKISLEDIYIDEHFANLHPDTSTGKHLQLKISDTGHGISKENKERIFDPFFTTKPKGEGTGLGLSVVHGIIKSFKGTVSVYSEVDHGTEFTLLFPVIADASAANKENDDVVLPLGDERIMLIDDEISITAVEKEMLESLGYSVGIFNDSILALEHFKMAPDVFDIVITDYTMPQMTGLDIASQIRNIRSDIPIILCSGHFDISTEKHAYELGIIECLNKPLTTSDLAFAVRRAFQNKNK